MNTWEFSSAALCLAAAPRGDAMPPPRIVVAGRAHCVAGRAGARSFPARADAVGCACGMLDRRLRGIVLLPVDVALVLGLPVDGSFEGTDDLDVNSGGCAGTVCNDRLDACTGRSAGPKEMSDVRRPSLPSLARRRAASKRPERPSQNEPTEAHPSVAIRRGPAPMLPPSVAPDPTMVLGLAAPRVSRLPLLGSAAAPS